MSRICGILDASDRLEETGMDKMVGVEIDMVVSDSLGALALYESIFDTERVEVTSFEKGRNEAVFNMYGVRFHLLDENAEYQMMAPKPDDPKPVWMNVLVPDIRATFAKAIGSGCTEIQPVTEMKEMGGINAIFADPFGHMWLLHEIVAIVDFETRSRILEENMKTGDK